MYFSLCFVFLFAVHSYLEAQDYEIIFFDNRDGSYDIWLTNSDGSEQFNLSKIGHDTNNQFSESAPRWSPDGKKVAFISNKSGAFNIWIMDADGSNDFNLTNSFDDEDTPCWSPDGMRLFFARNLYPSRTGCAPCSYWEIFTKDLITGIESRLTYNQYREMSPRVSPDGKFVVYTKAENPNDCCNQTDVWIMRSDGSDQLPICLEHNGYYEWAEDWGSSNNKILFAEYIPLSTPEIFCIDPNGTNLVRLTNNNFYDYPTKFSPDGQNVLFISNRNGAYNLWVMKTYDESTAIPLTNGISETWGGDWRVLNSPPVVNAGDNIVVSSSELANTAINGQASDNDINDELSYRWKEEETILKDWSLVGNNGECPLDLNLMFLTIGTHILKLQVSDGTAVIFDEMILAIENSAPHVVPSGSGVYEICSSVILGGFVSDYDGDTLSYCWKEEENTLFSGIIQTLAGGDPTQLPDYIINNLGLGDHILNLHVNDGINNIVSSSIKIMIVDSTVPTLSPIADKSILWPPNHRMVSITIQANAADNSGTVILDASVMSNEPEDGLGDGDSTPDSTIPIIDQKSGTISISLRAERSGSGIGRVYKVIITAKDSSSNTSTAAVVILVPHDKKM